eukprot:5689953-Pyramimonas_sp.AAC.1
MATRRPAWMAKSSEGRESKVARVGEALKGHQEGGQKPAGGKGKKQPIDELVVVLAKLVLNDEAELRVVIGAVYDTWLLPVDSAAVQAMLEEN